MPKSGCTRSGFYHVCNCIIRSSSAIKNQAAYLYVAFDRIASWFFDRRSARIPKHFYSNHTRIYAKLADEYSESEDQKKKYLLKASRFMEHHKGALLADEREDIYTYNLATLFFVKENFKKILSLKADLARKGKEVFKDDHYEIGFDFLVLKSHYCLDEDVFELPERLKRLKSQVNTSKQLKETHKHNYREEIYWFRKAVAVYGDTKKAQTVFRDCKASPDFNNKRWYEKKLSEITKGKRA